MLQVDLSCGTIDYVDSGGDGPVVVMLHGLLMDHTVWRNVIAELSPEHRCVAITLPEGSHRHPVKPEFDLTMPAVANLIGEFLEQLNLNDVLLVENDSGRAQTFAATLPSRVAALAIVACEAFENYPPGSGGKIAELIAWMPGGVWWLSRALQWRALRRSNLLFGRMSKRAIPDAVMDGWFRPLIEETRIRRDFQRYCRSTTRGDMLIAAEGLKKFDKPALIVWAMEDRMMPREHGQRFLDLLPNARLVEIAESRTLIPEDQPIALANALRKFSCEARAAAKIEPATALDGRGGA